MTRTFSTLIIFCFVVLPGCGSDDRPAISGKVTVDGAPLAEGEINFTPEAGTGGPTCGSMIQDGKYSIPAGQGPVFGTYRVAITAARPTGKPIRGPRGGNVEVMANYLPKRYNSQSEQTIHVAPNGPYVFDFDLQSK